MQALSGRRSAPTEPGATRANSAAGRTRLGDGAEDDGVVIPTPTLAVVGRPNVGKSTLVNRIIGRREAVVQDIPGVTRDRVSYEALWRGRKFTVVDTGGWEPDADGLQGAVAAQAERAMMTTDAVLVVVDGSVGATATEEAMAKVLRRSRRPVILAVNKVDDERTEADAAVAVVARARRAVCGVGAARPRVR